MTYDLTLDDSKKKSAADAEMKNPPRRGRAGLEQIQRHAANARGASTELDEIDHALRRSGDAGIRICPRVPVFADLG